MTASTSSIPPHIDVPEFKSTCLFGDIEAGMQDGYLVFPLDLAGAAACRVLGIEPVVAFVEASSPNGSKEGFFNWVQGKVGVALTDWRPVRVTLHEIWVGHRPTDASMGESSLQLWMGAGPVKSARASRSVTAFAIRHRSWRGRRSAATRRFLVDAHRSQLEALWDRDRPGEMLTHLACSPYAPGFVIHGRSPGADKAQPLTWPDADLEAVIRRASVLEAEGVEDLAIAEQGFLISFSSSEMKDWLRLVAFDLETGCSRPGLLIDAEMNGWIGLADEVAP